MVGAGEVSPIEVRACLAVSTVQGKETPPLSRQIPVETRFNGGQVASVKVRIA